MHHHSRRKISAGIFQVNSACPPKLKAWLAREIELPQGVPSKAAAAARFQELLRGGTERVNMCRRQERLWLSTTVSLGSDPSRGRGRQGGCPILASTAGATTLATGLPLLDPSRKVL